MSEPLKSSLQPKGHLLRILGVGFGIALIIGDTVGAGILRTPGTVAGQLRNTYVILAAWALGGLYALCCTLSVSELGTLLPRAGGWYLYSRRAFGEFAGFVVGCCDWMIQLVAIAYLAVAFGEFAVGLAPHFVGGVKFFAVGTVGVLAFLNWLGLRPGSRIQELLSLLKGVALLGFVVACFVLLPNGVVTVPTVRADLGGMQKNLLLSIVLALQAIVVTYDGWYGAIYFVEENTDPVRDLPRSAIAGVVSCIAIFLLVNLALLYALPLGRLVGSQMPAADAAMLMFGNYGRQIILVICLVTVVSTINATLLITPRIVFGMSRDGLLPSWAASVNQGGTPAAALIVSVIISLVLVLSGTFETLIAISSFLLVVVYLSGFVALFVLRRRESKQVRPFRTWGYPWTTIMVVLASAAFLTVSVISDLKHCFFTLALIALSYPVYNFFVKDRLASRKESPISSANR